jgi:F0F1-type ATP synthase assembly protein I
MAGFALGLIDSFQYFGGSLAGYMLGRLLDQSLGSYFYFMAPFGLIGGLLMLSIRGKISHGLKPAAPHTSARLRSPSVAHCRKGPGKAERSWH